VLPNLLVDDIARAIRASNALKVYVCNVATQPGETDGFGVAEHIQAIERHVGAGLLPVVLANSNLDHPLPADWALTPVTLRTAGDASKYQIISVDVVDERRPWRHEPAKLARVLMTLLEQQEETQYRVSTGVDEEVR
jgi:uncharacterized cofD-like protein